MPGVATFRMALRSDNRPVISLLGFYGWAKAAFVLITVVGYSVTEDELALIVLGTIWAAVALAISNYQTISFRLGLMPSEWGWLARQQRQYELDQKSSSSR
jgi:hypothetical protein